MSIFRKERLTPISDKTMYISLLKNDKITHQVATVVKKYSFFFKPCLPKRCVVFHQ